MEGEKLLFDWRKVMNWRAKSNEWTCEKLLIAVIMANNSKKKISEEGESKSGVPEPTLFTYFVMTWSALSPGLKSKPVQLLASAW